MLPATFRPLRRAPAFPPQSLAALAWEGCAQSLRKPRRNRFAEKKTFSFFFLKRSSSVSCVSNVHGSNRLKSLYSFKIPTACSAPKRAAGCERKPSEAQVLLRLKSTEAPGVQIQHENAFVAGVWWWDTWPGYAAVTCSDLHVHRFTSSSFISL